MTNWMPAARLATARTRQEDAMPDACTISRRTLTADGQGGSTEAWADLATSVSCRIIEQQKPVEGEIAMQVAGRRWWLLRLAYDQDITRADRVVISSTSYEVVGIVNTGSWMTSKRVVLVETD